MILNVATTPELFRTSRLSEELSWEHTNALSEVAVVPAGGGVNVAQMLYCAGQDTRVLVPAPEVSQFIRMLSLQGLPYEIVDVPGPIPVRYLIDSPAGRQLQFVDPPMELKVSELAILRDMCVAAAETAEWVVLAGVLPDIAHASWYVDVMRALRLYHPGVKIAVSTSGQPLGAVLRQVYTTKPDVLVIDTAEFDSTEQRDTAISTLTDAAVPHILVCHSRTHFELFSGATGASYSAEFVGDPGKQWLPWQDAALAGLLLADVAADPQAALISALAYANAPIGDPARAVPTPDVLQPELVQVR
ncbi:hypothetical protein HW450_01580 [Corynebacterium hindlerae]|uniref:Carbohydrate kinase PfkB domain-containing protein n=1 Tax=Corynebacterium hindlerae TaxID=699041 RepID=A0A7G5FFS9_9CORY|nr:hypothetical protein [Corynebacterium hindlerae]QMV85470.1 hypothetical protein HW450_01580 [Corynebacterium hindlerae]